MPGQSDQKLQFTNDGGLTWSSDVTRCDIKLSDLVVKFRRKDHEDKDDQVANELELAITQND